jgi:hypothetical protein
MKFLIDAQLPGYNSFPVSLRVLRALRGEKQVKKTANHEGHEVHEGKPGSVLMQRRQSGL